MVAETVFGKCSQPCPPSGRGQNLFSLVAISAAVALAVALAGCGGGSGTGLLPPADPVPPPVYAVELPGAHRGLGNWLENHPDRSYPYTSFTVPAGQYRDAGGVRFSCPAGGADCEVTVTSYGGLEFMVTSTGGRASAENNPLKLPDYVRSLGAFIRDSLTVPAGQHRDVGGVRFSCPADGADCEVTFVYSYCLGGGTCVDMVLGAVSLGGAATADLVPLPNHTVGLPGVHSLADWLTNRPVGSLTVPVGQYRDVGGVRFFCPAGGSDCWVTVTDDDGTIAVTSAGGMASADVAPPPPPRTTMTLPFGARHMLLADGDDWIGLITTVAAGVHEDISGVRFSCPAGGSNCSLQIQRTSDTLTVTSTGGVPTVGPAPGSEYAWPSPPTAAMLDRVWKSLVQSQGTQSFPGRTQDRTMALGYSLSSQDALLPGHLRVPTQGVIEGEFDDDGDPQTPTAFVNADAPAAISGWSGSAKTWKGRTSGGEAFTDTLAVYRKAETGQPAWMAFGWWLRTADSDRTGHGSYGNLPADDSNWTRGVNGFVAGRHKYWPGSVAAFNGLTGTATYAGSAAGQWAERKAGALDETSGAFTADTSLTADFGDATAPGTLRGSITNFRDASGATFGNWHVTLNSENTAITAGASGGGGVATGTWNKTAGAADGRGWTGRWAAQFYSKGATDSQTAYPTAVGGAFVAIHGTPGRQPSNDQGFVGVAGAFGAEKQ